MPLKAYFQDSSQARPVLKIGAIVWHLGWAGFALCALIGLLFLPASPFVIAALVVMAVPGAAAALLLAREGSGVRQLQIGLWSLAALVAVSLTGGLSGPLSAWIAMPMVAAVVLNQRSLISLGVTFSFVISLLATAVSLSQTVVMPDEQETFWLSGIAIFSLVVGLGVSLLPALRARTEHAADAEEGRARLLKMLTEQPQLIVCLDEQGRVVSAYGEAPSGLDLNHLVQLGLTASAHVPDRVAVKLALDMAMSNGRADVSFMPHAALEHYVHMSLRRANDNRLYGILSDASLQHAREAGLEAARAEADALNQGKTRFLAGMSHELRTPLNAVIGFSDIMRQQMFGPLSEKYADYSQLIWESGQHVLDMINDVLDMSKIEAQKYDLALESFDMREPVSAALRLLRGTAYDKHVEIKSLLPATALNVSADKRAIKQICLNLLSNAIKFTPRTGTVTLTLSEDGDNALIVIADTGIGIAPDDLGRLGQPYEQAGGAEHKAMGTGLGLSIVKAMAHLHGGAMAIESVLGQGTTVTVSLPVVSDPELFDVIPPVEAAPVVDMLPPVVTVKPDHPLQNLASDAASGFGEFVIRPPKS